MSIGPECESFLRAQRSGNNYQHPPTTVITQGYWPRVTGIRWLAWCISFYLLTAFFPSQSSQHLKEHPKTATELQRVVLPRTAPPKHSSSLESQITGTDPESYITFKQASGPDRELRDPVKAAGKRGGLRNQKTFERLPQTKTTNSK